jgi:hypothetical protein
MNYFEYFSEIEERFSRRRGSILLLSTLDWALIETWREAGIPLEAVLRGIDDAFDKHDARAQKTRSRKVNGLAWCAQAVMQAAEAAVEASTGAAQHANGASSARAALSRDASPPTSNATRLRLKRQPISWGTSARLDSETWERDVTATAQRLRELATHAQRSANMPLDELDRTLTVLEERLFATLQASATEAELVALRAQADRELAPYRAKMSAVQLRQVQAQFLHKRLLELLGLPRLSLFYMGHERLSAPTQRRRFARTLVRAAAASTRTSHIAISSAEAGRDSMQFCVKLLSHDLPAIKIHSGEPWTYRNRIRLRLQHNGGVRSLGYNRADSTEFLR